MASNCFRPVELVRNLFDRCSLRRDGLPARPEPDTSLLNYSFQSTQLEYVAQIGNITVTSHPGEDSEPTVAKCFQVSGPGLRRDSEIASVDHNGGNRLKTSCHQVSCDSTLLNTRGYDFMGIMDRLPYCSLSTYSIGYLTNIQAVRARSSADF
jgi:hypothetical protein